MKVLMINGSRREHGNTNYALNLIADSLKEEGIDSEIVFVGKDATNGNLNQLLKDLKSKCAEADGFVFASPVYYASPTGEIELVLDHLFGLAGRDMRHKPAAVVAVARRAGTTATLDALAKYPTINQMPVVSSSYWNEIHGRNLGEAEGDTEGVGVMKQLGKNMAWLLKCIEAGKKAGVETPDEPDYKMMNFIR